MAVILSRGGGGGGEAELIEGGMLAVAHIALIFFCIFHHG